MARRRYRASVVEVVCGGAALSLLGANCKLVRGPVTTNPPPSQPAHVDEGSDVTAPDAAAATGEPDEMIPEIAVPVDGAEPLSPPDPPIIIVNPPPAGLPVSMNPPPRLQTWDEVESGHPAGATNPPMPVLVTFADGRACFKEWVSPMIPHPELRELGGRVIAGAEDLSSEAHLTAIVCPEERQQALLERWRASQQIDGSQDEDEGSQP